MSKKVQKKNVQKIDKNDPRRPNPSGQAFIKLFKKHINTSGTPYMSAESLDHDIVLYRGMMIVLSEEIGGIDMGIQLVKKVLPSLTADDKQHLGKLSAIRQRVTKFMSGDAMISLRDNDYHPEHENQARLACYKFIKNDYHE